MTLSAIWRLSVVFLVALSACLSACNGPTIQTPPPSAPVSPEDESVPVALRGLSQEAKRSLIRTGGGEVIQDLYQDMTAESGVNFTYRNGQEADHYAILESLGG